MFVVGMSVQENTPSSTCSEDSVGDMCRSSIYRIVRSYVSGTDLTPWLERLEPVPPPSIQILKDTDQVIFLLENEPLTLLTGAILSRRVKQITPTTAMFLNNTLLAWCDTHVPFLVRIAVVLNIIQAISTAQNNASTMSEVTDCVMSNSGAIQHVINSKTLVIRDDMNAQWINAFLDDSSPRNECLHIAGETRAIVRLARGDIVEAMVLSSSSGVHPINYERAVFLAMPPSTFVRTFIKRVYASGSWLNTHLANTLASTFVETQSQHFGIDRVFSENEESSVDMQSRYSALFAMYVAVVCDSVQHPDDVTTVDRSATGKRELIIKRGIFHDENDFVAGTERMGIDTRSITDRLSDHYVSSDDAGPPKERCMRQGIVLYNEGMPRALFYPIQTILIGEVNSTTVRAGALVLLSAYCLGLPYHDLFMVQ